MARQDPPPKGRKTAPSGGGGGGAPPPSITIPPPKPKGGQSKGAVYDKYIKAHPALKPYSDLIWKWSKVYGIDPTYYAALLLFESGGKPAPEPHWEKGGWVVGIAQIHLPSHPGVTKAQAENPAFAIKWGAQFFSQKVQKHGSYDAAYRQGYNPGYTGDGPFAGLAKGYVPKGSGLSPAESAAVSVEREGAKKALQPGRWVVINPKTGAVSFKRSAAQPPGLSLTENEFLTRWGQWNDEYNAYAGRNAKANEVGRILAKGWSQYTVEIMLSKQPTFFKSPVWKSRAAQYQAIGKDIGVTPGRDLVRQAIVNNWSGESFAEKLREQPAYLQSNEFKTKTAGLSNVYRSIFGEVKEHDPAMQTIREAALGRWTPDQFAGWLRQTPEYQQSGEYLSRASTFFDQLSGILGVRPVLGAARPISTVARGAPESTRLPGVAQPPATQPYQPSFNP